jgi:ribosomal-protein-alanine N-acetyltransferase
MWQHAAMTTTRLLEPSDAEAMADLVARNREFLGPWEPVRPDAYFTLEGQVTVITEALERYEEGQQLPRVIMDETGAVVGRINLNSIVRGPFQSASVGYWLSQPAGGRGLATAAVAEMVTAGFHDMGLHRLEAGTLPENVRSQAVLLRNGFEQYGYARCYLSIAGRWQDHLLFQRVAEES